MKIVQKYGAVCKLQIVEPFDFCSSMTETLTFNVLQEIKTPSEPDVLLFSPIDSSVLIAGTYHLQEDGSRIGSLLVYRIDPSTTQWYLALECD